MSQTFRDIFAVNTKADQDRAKFLSRLFGIFSERIVSIWAKNAQSPYEDLGRPTIQTPDGSKGSTLDFTLRHRVSQKIYVTEMKCEVEYKNFKFFVLEDVSQLAHHTKPAFDIFLRAASQSSDMSVKANGKIYKSDGAILIWGAASVEGKKRVREAKGFQDVLTIEDICADLANWNCAQYAALVTQRQEWCNRLFAGMLNAHATQ